MTLEQLRETIPDYARDLKLNLSNVFQQMELTPSQAWGAALSCAIACRNAELLEAIRQEASKHLDATAMSAAASAAAIMGMNNIYYRFGHLSSNPKYGSMPARLRMQAIRSHGSDPVDFELWCAAVSAINGCGTCVDSHEKVLREKGVSEEIIIAAVRIASVLHATASVLEAREVAAAAQ